MNSVICCKIPQMCWRNCKQLICNKIKRWKTLHYIEFQCCENRHYWFSSVVSTWTHVRYYQFRSHSLIVPRLPWELRGPIRPDQQLGECPVRLTCRNMNGAGGKMDRNSTLLSAGIQIWFHPRKSPWSYRKPVSVIISTRGELASARLELICPLESNPRKSRFVNSHVELSGSRWIDCHNLPIWQDVGSISIFWHVGCWTK